MNKKLPLSATDMNKRIDETKKEIAQLNEELERLISSNVNKRKCPDEESARLMKKGESCPPPSEESNAKHNVDLSIKSSKSQKWVSVKDSNVKPPEPQCKKLKSYDPEAAKEYIRQQREKWMEERKKNNSKANTDKATIKQNLSALSQKSKALVQRNVQLKQNRIRAAASQGQIRLDRKTTYNPIQDKKTLMRAKSASPNIKDNSKVHQTMVKALENKSNETSKQKLKASFNEIPLSNVTFRRHNITAADSLSYADQNLAANKIQAFYRGYRTRQQLKADLKKKPDRLVVPEKSGIKETKETQTSLQQKRNETPTWLHTVPSDPYPCNFINTIKRKLQFVVDSPVQSRDIGVQSSLKEESVKKTEHDSEQNAQSYSKRSNLNSFVSHKCNLDADALQHLALLRGSNKPKDVNKKQLISDSDSDTSKNIPEISTESSTSIPIVEIYSSPEDLNKSFLGINTDKIDKLHLKNPLIVNQNNSGKLNTYELHKTENIQPPQGGSADKEKDEATFLKSPRDSIISFNRSLYDSPNYSTSPKSPPYDDTSAISPVTSMKSKQTKSGSKLSSKESTINSASSYENVSGSVKNSRISKTDIIENIENSINTSLVSRISEQDSLSSRTSSKKLNLEENSSRESRIEYKGEDSIKCAKVPPFVGNIKNMVSQMSNERSDSSQASSHHSLHNSAKIKMKSSRIPNENNSESHMHDTQKRLFNSKIKSSASSVSTEIEDSHTDSTGQLSTDKSNSNRNLANNDSKQTDSKMSEFLSLHSSDWSSAMANLNSHEKLENTGKYKEKFGSEYKQSNRTFTNPDQQIGLQQLNITSGIPPVNNSKGLRERKSDVQTQSSNSVTSNGEIPTESVKSKRNDSKGTEIVSYSSDWSSTKGDVNSKPGKLGKIEEGYSQISTSVYKQSSKSIANSDQQIDLQPLKNVTSTITRSKTDSNEIHLKFEAEVHLLNDFNESLKQFMAVEKAFETIKNKNDCGNKNISRNKEHSKNSSGLLFSEDSRISLDLSKSMISSVNLSRGTNIDDSHSLKHLSRQEISTFDESIDNNACKNMPNITGLSIKMFEQLIRDEDIRIENLKTIIKIREQALLDRTKGELAWLEIQKKHLKETGKLHEASLVKKKQRGILLKHQQERREMQRLKQLQKIQSNERKTILKEQRNLIKAKLTSEKIMTELKKQTPRKKKTTGPMRVLKSSESIHSETSISKKETDCEEIYSITSTRSRSIQLSEVDSIVDLVGNADDTIGNNENLSNMKRALSTRQAALMKRRRAVEDLLQRHQKLVEEEKKIEELEMAANAIIMQMPTISQPKQSATAKLRVKGEQLNELSLKMDTFSEKKFVDNKTFNLSQTPYNKLLAQTENYHSKMKDRSIEGSASDNSSRKSIPERDDTKSSENEEQRSNEISSREKSPQYSPDFEVDAIESDVIEETAANERSLSSINELIQDFSEIEQGISMLSKQFEPESQQSNPSSENISESLKDVSVIETNKTSPHTLQSLKLSDKETTEIQSGTLNSETSPSEIQVLRVDILVPSKDIAVDEEAGLISTRDVSILDEDVKKDDNIEISSSQIASEISPQVNSVFSSKTTEIDVELDSPVAHKDEVSIEEKHDIIEDQAELNTISSGLSEEIEDDVILVSKENQSESLEGMHLEDNTITNLESKETETLTEINEVKEQDEIESIDSLVSEKNEINDVGVVITEISEENSTEESSDNVEKIVSPIISEIEEKSNDVELQTKTEDGTDISEKLSTDSEPIEIQEIVQSQTSDNYTDDFEDDKEEKSNSTTIATVQKDDVPQTTVQEEKKFARFDIPTIVINDVDEDEIEELQTSSTIDEEAQLSPNDSLDEKDDSSIVNTKQRVSEILANTIDSKKNGVENISRYQDYYVTTYEDITPSNSPETVPAKAAPSVSLNMFGSEAEELLKKQLAIEQEIKHLEQQQKEQLPFVYMREIPNKPPPPYTPPTSIISTTVTILPSKVEDLNEICNYSAKVLYNAYLSNNLSVVTFSEKEFKSINQTKSTKDCCLFVFDLCREVAKDHYRKFEKENAPTWLKLPENTKLALGKPFGYRQLENHINTKVKELLGFKKPNIKENAVSKWNRKKKDHVDEILVLEAQTEEHEWLNNDKEELIIKNEVTNQIFEMLLSETVGVFRQIFS